VCWWDNGTDSFHDLTGLGKLGHSGGGILIESQSSQTLAHEGPY
jgi:hypothetical protein